MGYALRDDTMGYALRDDALGAVVRSQRSAFLPLSRLDGTVSSVNGR